MSVMFNIRQERMHLFQKWVSFIYSLIDLMVPISCKTTIACTMHYSVEVGWSTATYAISFMNLQKEKVRKK